MRRTIQGLILLIVLAAVLLVVYLLAGRRADEEPESSPAPPTETAEAATQEPDESTSTPAAATEATEAPPAADLAEQALSEAVNDLAARLDIRPAEIGEVDADTAAGLQAQINCPTLGLEVPVYSIFLQVDQVIYPYQYYVPADGGDMVLEACEAMVGANARLTPTPDARAQILDVIKRDLSQRTGIPIAQIGEPRRLQAMTWTDEALGCRLAAGQQPTPAVIEGFLVLYDISGQLYEYHSNTDGTRVVFCEPPQGFERSTDLIAAIQTDGTLELTGSADPARYNGLDQEGVLILLGPAESRVGLFDFPTPEEARAAADWIDDERVSKIFVSGKVLIVEEDFNPQVYSTLLQYAQEVRSPIDERGAE